MRRFNRKPIEWTRQGDCMICTSHKPNQDGYIRMCRGGRFFYLNRVICERRHGPLLACHDSRHTCDNTRCINPDHIIPGTHRQNMDDATERSRMAFGERSGRRKLSEDQVKTIWSDQRGCTTVARDYGVRKKCIRDIKRGISWRRVTQWLS